MLAQTTSEKLPTVADLSKDISQTINRIRGVYTIDHFSMASVKNGPAILDAQEAVTKATELVLNGIADRSVFRNALEALEQAYMDALGELREETQRQMQSALQGYKRCG